MPGSSYGLLIGPALSTASLPRTAVLPSAGLLEIINTCGLVVMSTPLGAASVQNCAAGSPNAFQTPASLQVPVSASADRVYYRDGDTRIRWLTPNGQTGDAATVPGGPATISFFSVSPDDQRIAVVVADFSPASTINQRLYVEDLSGGGHHVDLYTTSTPKGGDGSILWPMGWHQGRLVVAVLPACGYPQESLSPSAWHVVDASTGNRLVAITSTCGDGISGTLSLWPSPAGVICIDGSASLYDWTGKRFGFSPGEGTPGYQSQLSPSGRGWFASGNGRGVVESYTHWSNDGYEDLFSYAGCLWIDEDHVLTPYALVTRGTPGTPDTFVPFVQGVCAGSFPGGL